MRILSLNLGIWIATDDNTATMHIVIIDAHIKLVDILYGLLGGRASHILLLAWGLYGYGECSRRFGVKDFVWISSIVFSLWRGQAESDSIWSMDAAVCFQYMIIIILTVGGLGVEIARSFLRQGWQFRISRCKRMLLLLELNVVGLRDCHQTLVIGVIHSTDVFTES